jgi:hypothetical protein
VKPQQPNIISVPQMKKVSKRHHLYCSYLSVTYYDTTIYNYRSHLKKRILAQGQGGTEFQPAGILKYFEDLKRGLNTEIGQKDFFEIAYSLIQGQTLSDE